MSQLAVVVWLVVGLTVFACTAAAWTLLREAWRRRSTVAAVKRLEKVMATLDPSKEIDAAEVTAIAKKVDARTLERALETMLRSADERTRLGGVRLFDQLGIVDRFATRVREAGRWSDRAHAAEVLGLAASPKAVPSLVAAIRDPHEDMGSVKLAAANALAKLKDPAAVPFLVKELELVDEHASPRVADAIVRFGSIALPPLLELLSTIEHGPGRVWAARVVGRIGDRSAIDALVARLADRHDMLRGAAAEALGVIGDRRALQAVIITTLRDPAPQVRAHAAAAASKIAGEDAVDVLVAALSDPDYGTRLRALEAFEHIDVRETAGLERALHDVNPEVRRRAALALERVGFLERVVAGLASEDFDTAQNAYRDLIRLGSAGLVDSIIGYIHHASFQVRARVASACGELSMTRTGPLLVSALDDESWAVRAAICEAIGRLRVPDATAPLVKLLGDSNEVVREAAAQALAEFSDDALRPHMMAIGACYGPGTVVVRWHIVGMVARAGGDESFDLLVEASRDPSERVRARSVNALVGRAGAVPALVERLEDPALEVRMAAVSALGSAATEEAFEGLVRALPGAPLDARERIAQALAKSAQGGLLQKLFSLAKSGTTDVRLGITWALGKSGDAAAVPTLAQLLADADPRVRASAAGALGKIPSLATEKTLMKAADDRDSKVRAAIVNALAKVGTEAVVPTLEKRISDPDGFIRNRAAIALARLGAERARPSLVDAEKKELVDPVALAIAWSLVPGDEALERTLTLFSEPPRFERVRAAALREDAPVSEAFHARLRLEMPTSDAQAVDAAALVLQYERLLAESQDVEGRVVAVEALSRIGMGRALDVLGDVLAGDPIETVRLHAANALAKRAGDEFVRRALIRAATDPSAPIALVAIRAIAETRDVTASPVLHKRLGLGTPEVRSATEAAIARIHQDDVMTFLDRMMGEDRPDVLAASVRVLERIASRDAAPLLVELAHSREAVVRGAAIRALAVLDVPEAATEVTSALEDPSEGVRAEALSAITRARSSASFEKLARLRGDPSARIRAELAAALEHFEEVSARELTDTLAADISAVVRGSALVTMLARADGAAFDAFARHWSKAALDTKEEIRSSDRKERVTKHLVEVLDSVAESKLRAIAVTGISALEADGWPELLVRALRDPVPAVRIAAVRALGHVAAAEVRARVAELLGDPDPSVREAAKRANLRLLG